MNKTITDKSVLTSLSDDQLYKLFDNVLEVMNERKEHREIITRIYAPLSLANFDGRVSAKTIKVS